MCLDVFVHYTDESHDTRFLSIINPKTRYTVHSPWQEPYKLYSCKQPHAVEPIPPGQACPWHPGCCRLERFRLCSYPNPSICVTWLKYHHLVDEEEGQNLDLNPLREYLTYNPPLLFIVGWLFKKGVQLALAHERLGDDNHEHSDTSDLIESLGQFAILWDLNTRPGGLPPRPGQRPNPEHNEDLAQTLGLRVKDWGLTDDGKPPWPRNVRLRDVYRTGIIAINDNPSVITSSGAGENQTRPIPQIICRSSALLPDPPIDFLSDKNFLLGGSQDSGHSKPNLAPATSDNTNTDANPEASEIERDLSLSCGKTRGRKRGREEEE
ncbi:hypothetical protein F5Y04DRAFT_178823 [Hypomontagnella monticulosa]|nr:hypothetical protein F5Y04DRAFT_178823 [Hypomontagnella monticulosa]